MHLSKIKISWVKLGIVAFQPSGRSITFRGSFKGYMLVAYCSCWHTWSYLCLVAELTCKTAIFQIIEGNAMRLHCDYRRLVALQLEGMNVMHHSYLIFSLLPFCMFTIGTVLFLVLVVKA
jgi:hypothetical protein